MKIAINIIQREITDRELTLAITDFREAELREELESLKKALKLLKSNDDSCFHSSICRLKKNNICKENCEFKFNYNK